MNADGDDEDSLFVPDEGPGGDQDESLFVDDKDLEYKGDAVNEGNDVQQTTIAPSEGEPIARPNIDSRIAILTVNMSFQQKIIRDMLADDGLLIMSKGLGVQDIAVNLLYALDIAGTDPADRENSLVLLIGARDGDAEYIQGEMERIKSESTEHSTRGLTIVTEKMHGNARAKAYVQGGLFSVTSRILVVDMLNGTVDCSKVTGVIVLNAHNVSDTSNIAFILRLYRERNKIGFIKALSDRPEAFGSGYSPLARQLKNLRLKKTWLWPRFHIQVKQALSKKESKDNTIEIAVQLTERMQDISKDIRGCMQWCLSELKRLNPTLETENWTLENVYYSGFLNMVRAQLNPLWHRISHRSKQLVYDLATLRDLLVQSTSTECVRFLRDLTYIHKLAVASMVRGSGSGWVELPEADDLVRLADERVFGSISQRNAVPVPERPQKVPVEEVPKWEQLSRVLAEITTSEEEPRGPILIMCQGSVRQLQVYLYTVEKETMGEETEYNAQALLKKKREAFLNWKRNQPSLQALIQLGPNAAIADQMGRSSAAPAQANSPSMATRTGFVKRRRVRGGGSVGTSSREGSASVARESPEENNDLGEKFVDEVVPLEDEDVTIAKTVIDLTEENDMYDEYESTLVKYDQYFVWSDMFGESVDRVLTNMDRPVFLHRYDDQHNEEVIRKLQPSHIIMYEPDPVFVRNIEVYRNTTGKPVKVYFMYYNDSVEEEEFLYQVRREKDAFTRLIREKASMPIILDDDDVESHNSLLRTVSTRVAGGQILRATTEQPRVIVDVREFNSSVPFLLHVQKFQIVPVTLQVGDYIPTPRICVERKSVSDLIQSLNNGRLFKQCSEMFKYYEMPVLLIEFDEGKSFSLEPLTDERRSRDLSRLTQSLVQQKVSLLLLHYPKLKIIWSSGPHHTSEIFAQIKRNREEPNSEQARQIGLQNGDDVDRFENDTAIEMLQSIPGINYSNYTVIINNVPNLRTLAMMSQQEIAELIGSEAAKKVYRFMSRAVGKVGA